MSVIHLGPFLGMRPRISPLYLEEGQAQRAEDTKLWSGEVRPFFADSHEAYLGDVGRVNTIHLLADKYWLVSQDAGDITQNALAEEVDDRVMFTVSCKQGHNPRVIDTSMIEEAIDNDYYDEMYGDILHLLTNNPAIYLNPPDEGIGPFNTSGWNVSGFNEIGEEMPDIYYTVGVPAPEEKPDVDVISAGSGSPLDVIWCYTYVNAWGEEGKPGPYSVKTTIEDGHKVELSTSTGNEILNLDLGGATGGTFTLNDSEPIAYDVTDEDLTLLLEGIYGEDNVAVVSGVITFTLEVGESKLEADFSELTGATDPELSVIQACANKNNYVPITHKRIYRWNTGTEDGVFQFVDEIPIDQEVYTDEKSNADLEEAMETVEFDLPPSDLHSIIRHPAGYLIGFSGKEVCFSEPGYDYAWPRMYRFNTDWDIVGGGIVGNTAVVLTKAYPYLVYGSTPEESYLHKVPANYGCINQRGIKSTEYGVVFPSKTGLCIARDSGEIINTTSDDLTVDEWRVYSNGMSHAEVYDRKYFGFYENEDDSGAFIFDASEPQSSFVIFSRFSPASWVRPDTGQMFIQQGRGGMNRVVEFEGNKLLANPYKWKSKKFPVPPINMSAARVDYGVNELAQAEIRKAAQDIAGDFFDYDTLMSYGGTFNGAHWNAFDFNGDALSIGMYLDILNYDVYFVLFVDREEVFRRKVVDDRPFRLPTGYKASHSLEFQLEGTANVQRLTVGTSMEGVANAR